MVNVHTARILSDPLKIARHYYVVEPFLPEEVQFRTKNRRYQELVETAKEYYENNRIISGVKPYRQLHQLIASKLDRLKEKKIMFVTGLSVDQTGEGKQLGYDAFSIRNKLSDEIIRIMTKLSIDKDYSMWVFIPISPFFSPYRFNSSEGRIEYVYSDLVLTVNEKQKGLPLGITNKQYEEITPKRGFSQFGSLLYDSCVAKKVFECPKDKERADFERTIQECTNFNRHILAMAYSNILQKIGIKGEVDIYSAKTSYAYDIIELASKYSNEFKLSSWNVFSGISMPHEREANKAALRRLNNRIKNRSNHDKKKLEDLL